MEREIWEILKALDEKKLTVIEAHKNLCGLYNVSNSTCDQIFENDSKVDDYEFNLHQHWKDYDDRNGFDSKPIGGFSEW